MNAKKLMPGAFLAGLLVLLGAFGVRAEVPSPRVVGEDIFTIARGPCLGTCPMFELTLLPDGTVIFDGERYVPKMGVHRAKLPAETFEAVVRELLEIDFYAYREVYAGWAKGVCGSAAADLPSVQLSLRLELKEKNVYWDQGCSDFEGEAELRRAIAAIDELLKIEDWLNE
ncbi:MAG: DUF6438 domain-containing protein [Sphingomonadales bacterium]